MVIESPQHTKTGIDTNRNKISVSETTTCAMESTGRRTLEIQYAELLLFLREVLTDSGLK